MASSRARSAAASSTTVAGLLGAVAFLADSFFGLVSAFFGSGFFSSRRARWTKAGLQRKPSGLEAGLASSWLRSSSPANPALAVNPTARAAANPHALSSRILPSRTAVVRPPAAPAAASYCLVLRMREGRAYAKNGRTCPEDFFRNH